jgi:D-galactarolactone cycloisomerase
MRVKIEAIEAFQVRWTADDKSAQRSAFVRVRAEDGLFGIGEASPMQAGSLRSVSSSMILRRD